MRILGRRRGPDLDCREVGKVLQRYLDRELDERTSVAVARHLEACRHCGMEASTYQDLKRSLADMSAGVDEEAITRLREFVQDLTADREPDLEDR